MYQNAANAMKERLEEIQLIFDKAWELNKDVTPPDSLSRLCTTLLPNILQDGQVVIDMLEKAYRESTWIPASTPPVTDGEYLCRFRGKVFVGAYQTIHQLGYPPLKQWQAKSNEIGSALWGCDEWRPLPDDDSKDTVWISVLDRLPTVEDADENGSVLCCHATSQKWSAKYVCHWDCVAENVRLGNTTHWRRLPAGPNL